MRDRWADVRLADLAPLLERHLPEGDPVRAYAVPLRGPLGDQPLRGYLTGSVDVVLRVPTPDGPRFHVVDYKTNWLGPDRRAADRRGLRPAALDAAMGHSDYPLQALLYAAVLHRFLRWRLPAYDPERHLGEVLYLYVRGMCGPETPDRRRDAVRGVHVARAGAARRGAVRPARGPGDGMTELFEPTGEHDWRLARGRTGLLAAFNDGLLLTAADLHVAARVGALGGEDDERVLLALALAVRAVRRGSVCLSLDEVRADAPDLPWPEPEAWAAPYGARGWWTRACCAGTRTCCTSTATTASRPRYATTSRPAPPSPRPTSTRRGWRPRWRRCVASTPAPSSSRRPRPPCAGGRRSSPAAPARARRPRSRGCWRCSPTRPPRAASGSRSR